MYRKEVNERSPMRVFEKSIHGGLGRGNVGVIVSRPGVGKKALLVQIALDDLLRDRRVLHISTEHPVDHVRAYYDELFHDLATYTRLAEPEAVRLDIERHRLIFSLLGHAEAPESAMKKLLETVTFARDVAHFSPDVIIMDGFDFAHASDEMIDALAGIARDCSAEIWLTTVTKAAQVSPGSAPEPISKFFDKLGVIIYLEPEKDVIRLRLLKDHDSKDLAEITLRLDAHTMRIIDQDLLPPSERRRDAKRFRLHSGGAKGAEATFGACAERWGLTEYNYSFEGHTLRERQRGVVMLSETDLRRGDFSLVYVSKRLGRVLSEIPLVRNVLQTIWYQINAAREVFVIGQIQDDGTVRGGTGWGAELARLWKKPLYVFDQQKRTWFRWSGKAWEMVTAPIISSESFAGIGTQNLTDDGKVAITELFQRSFGDPS
ncbi:MAG TPA: AAA family ATPase [Polyangium sp.]|jgi:archaellum biogenesis ATPase FlaH|nr:AAA family ATPase [Polyangium sp.]